MSRAIEIKPVKTGAELARFLKLPESIYAGNPCWVCPLLVERKEFFDRGKNPFFDTAEVALFLALQDGIPVGRISAHISRPYNEYHREKTGFFGFYESIDEFAVAEALFRTAAEWVRERGMDRLRGPMNFTTNHELGLLLDVFDRPPVIMMPYNPEYYVGLFEKFGLVKAMDLYAYYGTDDQPIPERVKRVIERVKQRSGCTIRPIDFGNFSREAAAIKNIYNGAWADNWGFVPMSGAEFDFTAKDMKKIADPELILIAEDAGRPVGFSMALPDFNQVLIRLNGRLLPFGLFKLLWLTKVRHVIDGVRVLTMGILPEYRRRGLDNIFYYETFERGVARGYKWGEFSWILENNDMMNRAAQNLGYRKYKTYRIYDYPLR
jgi:GNAT superfamily N-acetyltransferase